jgi:hypothetical protein
LRHGKHYFHLVPILLLAVLLHIDYYDVWLNPAFTGFSSEVFSPRLGSVGGDLFFMCSSHFRQAQVYPELWQPSTERETAVLALCRGLFAFRPITPRVASPSPGMRSRRAAVSAWNALEAGLPRSGSCLANCGY